MPSEAELPQPRSVPPALQALWAPDVGMERQARVGRAKLAFLIAFACALLSAFAFAARVDGREFTVQKLQKTNQLDNMSDRQLEDETRNSERLFQVARVAQGALEAPLQLGLGALSVLALVWFLRGKLKGRAVVPVAAAALLPGAIANILDALSAWQHASVPPQNAVLAPRNLSAVSAILGHALDGPWLKLGNAFDFFSLWSALLLGFGVAAAGELPPRRALVATFAGWVCVRLLVAVAIGG